MTRIAALLLDTIASDGFDGPKLLARFAGSPLVEHTVARALTWPVDEVVVVLGADGDIVAASTDLAGATVIHDEEHQEGTAAALRAGLDYLMHDAGFEGALVAFADQPNIDLSAVEAVVAQDSSRPITVARYRYARGAPYLIRSAVWQRLMGIEGDLDLDHLAATHPQWVDEVWVTHLAPRRIISPLDLAEMSPR